MTLKSFVDFVKFRRLRSGAVFSQYYVVPNPEFDLDALGFAAAEREMDEPPVDVGGDPNADGEWEDEDDEPLTPVSSGPSTPAPPTDAGDAGRTPGSTPSPLSSIPSTPASARSRSRTSSARADSPRAKTQHVVKGGGCKRRRKEHGRRNRAKKRKLAADRATNRDRERHQARRVLRSEAIHVDYDLDDAPVTKTGFRARYEPEVVTTHTRQELLDLGFVYYPWDGRGEMPIVTSMPREPPEPRGADPEPANGGSTPAPRPPVHLPRAEDEGKGEGEATVDNDVVIGCLAGRPSDGEASGREPQPSWDGAMGTLAAAIEEGRGKASFSHAAREHRRGIFGAQAVGVSHGGGQIRPANLKHSVRLTLALMYLISLPAMVRVAHFGSAAFARWAPAIHNYYATTLLALLASDESLARNFAGSVWACLTINFGPRTVCFPHRDYANLAFGWCAITALGDYDPDKGGDLVLWDCKMVIRFPPGSTILIPSAIVRHSNTEIGAHEHRYSVTQYSAGALFRWVAHGFQLDEEYFASLSADGCAKEEETAARRWRRGRAMFSRLSDLVAAAEKRA
ncbi:hypothetical protein HDZ31DRAFT_66539 [Schizophyllum fasciatum]